MTRKRQPLLIVSILLALLMSGAGLPALADEPAVAQPEPRSWIFNQYHDERVVSDGRFVSAPASMPQRSRECSPEDVQNSDHSFNTFFSWCPT